MVLNSKFFGVPQNRERVFIIGSLRGESKPEILPFRESNKSSGRISQLNNPRHSNDRIYAVDGISPTLNTAQGGNRQPNIITSTITTENAHVFGKNVTARQAFDIASLTGKIRRLTPLECERLQGFPDNWTEGFSDTQRYKMMGNAVTVNVIRTIGEKLLEASQEK
jgi:DNA (cytosine-5)-methyltransferase 1